MLQPRTYQQAILETAKRYNTLCVLPTGLGKSLICLLLAAERFKHLQGKVLVLAPTRPLAAQWVDYFKKHFPLNKEVHLLTGKINPEKRREIWEKAEIIVSTPECIRNDLEKGLSLADVILLTEDECHRCRKRYAYTAVAQAYLKQAKWPRLLGLTASPASDPAVIKAICDNLGIQAVEIRTRESEDVKPYLQKLYREVVKVELPDEFKSVKALLEEIYKKKIEELKKRGLLFHRVTKKSLLELQAKLQRNIATGNRNFNVLRGSSVCAQAIKLQHGLELLETQGVWPCYAYFQELFEQANQNKSKAVKQLVKNKEFGEAYIRLCKLYQEGVEHPKLQKLKELMLQELKVKPNLKALIFSQYRDTINRINAILVQAGISSRIFIGQAKRKEPGLSQQEQQAILREFNEGKITCLVSSSIGEEGLDITEVDLVVFYEPIPSAIRTIQRRGRTARLKPGKLIVLMAKDTRDESYYWAAYHKEKQMYGILKDFKQRFEKKQQTKQKQLNDFSNFHQ